MKAKPVPSKPATPRQAYPVTPDGRYFVVRGRLWRCTNPHLAGDERHRLTLQLMAARRAVRTAKQTNEVEALAAAHHAVDAAKVALGERGPVWWDDGAADLNRHMVRTTPYAGWYDSLKTIEEP